MQQELIEMLDKMIKHFEYISTDSYYAKETGTILSEAEKLIEKAKNNMPAVPHGWKLVPIEPTKEMLDAVAWHGEAGSGHIDLSVMAPAPAQEVGLTDEEIDAATRHLYHGGKPISKEYRVSIARAALRAKGLK